MNKTDAHDATFGANTDRDPSKNAKRAPCQIVPGLDTSLPKSRKTGHSSANSKFMEERWFNLCELLSVNGADCVSAEMCFAMVHALDLQESTMHVAAAVYLCLNWGSQCGRTDFQFKQQIMFYLGYDSEAHSDDMKQFAKVQFELMEKLNFDVRRFGKTSFEFLAQGAPTTLSILKWCVALTFFEPDASAEQRAIIAAADGGLDAYKCNPAFTAVMGKAGRLIAFYIKRSKDEERWCGSQIAKTLLS